MYDGKVVAHLTGVCTAAVRAAVVALGQQCSMGASAGGVKPTVHYAA
jgi:hypothetical protein